MLEVSCVLRNFLETKPHFALGATSWCYTLEITVYEDQTKALLFQWLHMHNSWGVVQLVKQTAVAHLHCTGGPPCPKFNCNQTLAKRTRGYISLTILQAIIFIVAIVWAIIYSPGPEWRTTSAKQFPPFNSTQKEGGCGDMKMKNYADVISCSSLNFLVFLSLERQYWLPKTCDSLLYVL